MPDQVEEIFTFLEEQKPSSAPVRVAKGLGNIVFALAKQKTKPNQSKLENLKAAFTLGFERDIGPQQSNRKIKEVKAQMIAQRLQAQGFTPQGAEQLANGNLPTADNDLIKVNALGKRQLLIGIHREFADF